MKNRDMTLAEIQAMVEELAGKVTVEGAELYEKVKAEVAEMVEKFEELDIDAKMKELHNDLMDLYEKVSAEGAEIIDKIEDRIDELHADVQEELAELKEKGFMQWVKDNMKIVVLGGFAVVVVVLVVLNMLGVITPTPAG